MGWVLIVVIAWLATSYVILPAMWRHYEHHPELATAPKTTLTKDGIPGDPLNFALVGTQDQVIHSLTAAGWLPADPVTLKSSVAIAESVLLHRSYPEAPVSPLLVFGRKQDLAFEKPFGKSPKERHHLRLWKSDEHGRNGRPMWLGAVTFDRSVGVSHYTGQITHHIDPDVDEERDDLIAGLVSAKQVETEYEVTGVGLTTTGRNGGGDWYYTDGEMAVAVLSPTAMTAEPKVLANPTVVVLKNRIWNWMRSWLLPRRHHAA